MALLHSFSGKVRGEKHLQADVFGKEEKGSFSAQYLLIL